MKKTCTYIGAALLSILLLNGCGNKVTVIEQPSFTSGSEMEADYSTKAVKVMEQADNRSNDPMENLYSFTIKLGKQKLTFPMSYTALTDKGFQTTDSLRQELNPLEISEDKLFIHDGIAVYAQFFNDTPNVQKLVDCSVAGIIIDTSMLDDDTDRVVLPKGVTLGVSTRAEIEYLYGAPDNTYELEGDTQLSYEYDSGQNILLNTDHDTKVVDSIDLHCYKPISRNLQLQSRAVIEVDVIKEKEESSRYKQPVDLGDDIYSSVVEFDHELYELPAPVKEFLDHGWTLEQLVSNVENENQEVSGMSNSQIILTKMDQDLQTTVKNYSTTPESVEDCYVTNISAGSKTADVEIMLPTGITRGMSGKELRKLLKKVKYTKEQTPKSTVYIVRKGENAPAVTEIILDSEMNTVEKISVIDRRDTLE